MNHRTAKRFHLISLIALIVPLAAGGSVMSSASTGFRPANWGLARAAAVTPQSGATFLDPNDFTSLGPNPFTTSGPYVFDTSGPTPTLTGPGIVGSINGIVHLNGTQEIAVFTFDDIEGGNLFAVRNANSRPLALLSKGHD